MIEERCELIFESSGTVTEYYDWNSKNRSQSYMNRTAYYNSGRYDNRQIETNNRLQLNNFPIVDIVSVSINNASATSADSWEDLTEIEGSGGDYLADYEIGAIDFLSQIPRYGHRSVKVSYKYGALDRNSKTPKIVKRLCALISAKSAIGSKSSKSQFDSTNDVSIGAIRISNKIGSTTTYVKNWSMEIDSLFEKVIGTFSSSRGA